MADFKQGDLVKAIYFNHSGDGYDAEVNCASIIVRMECGQMAGVPWFEVWMGGEVHSKYNGALLAFVEL